MIDNYHRQITYLRISVTDRCNLRCTYCMPQEGVKPLGHNDILRYEEILRIARVAVGLGVKSIRVTGGEPLVRRGIINFVRGLAGLKTLGLGDIAMTTNGALLAQMAASLKKAGLDRVNVSLDTLSPGKFSQITRFGMLENTLKGIGAAISAGLQPVKINVVVTRSTNLSEVVDFACLAHELPVIVRFIELMPLGCAEDLEAAEFVSGKQVLAILRSRGTLHESAVGACGSGPARYFTWSPHPDTAPSAVAARAIDTIRTAAVPERVEKGQGALGFITAISDHFCPSCNRLRLTSDGKINPCLWSDLEVDLKEPLRSGASDEEIARIILEAACLKPGDYEAARPYTHERKMSRLGG